MGTEPLWNISKHISTSCSLHACSQISLIMDSRKEYNRIHKSDITDINHYQLASTTKKNQLQYWTSAPLVCLHK